MENNIKSQIKKILFDKYKLIYTPNCINNLYNILIQRSNNLLLKVLDSNIDIIDDEIDELVEISKYSLKDKIDFCKNINIGSKIFIKKINRYANVIDINIPYITFQLNCSTDKKKYEILFSKIGLEMICTKCSNKFNLFLKSNINYRDLVCNGCKDQEKYSPLLLTPNMFTFFKDFCTDDKVEIIKKQLIASSLNISHITNNNSPKYSRDIGPPPGLGFIPKFSQGLKVEKEIYNIKENINTLSLPPPVNKCTSSPLGSVNLHNIKIQEKYLWDNPPDKFNKRIIDWNIIKNKELYILKKKYEDIRIFYKKSKNIIGDIRKKSDVKIYLEKIKTTNKVVIKIKNKNLKNIIKSLLLIESIVEYNGINTKGYYPDNKLPLSFNKILNITYDKYINKLKLITKQQDKKIIISKQNNNYTGFIITCNDKNEKIFLENLVFGVNKIHLNVLSKIDENTYIYLYNIEKKTLNGVFKKITDPELNIINNVNYENYQAQIKVKYIINKRQLTLNNCFFGPCTIEHNNTLLKLFNK